MLRADRDRPYGPRVSRARLRARIGLAVTVLAGVATPCIVGAASAVNPAVSFIEHGVIEMRTDPEASRRDAEAALQSLQRQPDVDLEIQARLILCDYQAERDTRAALEQIEAATALLPQAQRKGIQAGLLDCRGEIFETAGDNTRARGLYEQAVAVATSTHDEEMLAQSLFSRGYLLGLQGEFDVRVVREGRLHFLGFVTDDHNLPRDAGLAGRVEHVIDHRPPADFMQHLGERRLHPRALPRSQNHGNRCIHAAKVTPDRKRIQAMPSGRVPYNALRPRLTRLPRSPDRG